MANNSSVDVSLEAVAQEQIPFAYAAIKFMHYSSFVITPLGLLGNSLAIIIFSKLNEGTSGIKFMQLLAVVDNFALVKDGFLQVILPGLGIDLRLVSNFSCKVTVWLSAAITSTGSHIIMTIGFDRILALYYPFKYREYGKPWRAQTACIVIALYQTVLWSPALLFCQISEHGCDYDDTSLISRKFLGAWVQFEIVQYALGPIILIIISNVLIVARLRKGFQTSEPNSLQMTRLVRCDSGNKAPTERNARLRSEVKRRARTFRQDMAREITRQLCLASTVFALLIGSTIIQGYFVTMARVETPAEQAIHDFSMTGINFAGIINHSANFLLYAMAGRSFRAKFCNLMRGRTSNSFKPTSLT